MSATKAPPATAAPPPPVQRRGRVTVVSATGEPVVARIRVSPGLRHVIATVLAESLAGWVVVAVITVVAAFWDNPPLRAGLPAWWAAAAFLPFLAAVDTVIFGQNEAAYVGASTIALRPPLGFWYVLRRVSALQPRYAPIHQPWWAPQHEMGQQGAGVVLVGPEPVGVRFGNGLSEEEARLVLDTIASIPPSLEFHEEVGPSTTDVTVRWAIGLVIAIAAFALIFTGLANKQLQWLVGVGDLTLLWVAYRFWFNLFRRRPEYAK